MPIVYDTDISYVSHTGRQRPWGYEIPAGDEVWIWPKAVVT